MRKSNRLPQIGDIVRVTKPRHPNHMVKPGAICIINEIEVNMPVFINEAGLYVLGKATGVHLPFESFELVEEAQPGRSTEDEVTEYYVNSRREAMAKRRTELGLPVGAIGFYPPDKG
jgi:hypothetical protein